MRLDALTATRSKPLRRALLLLAALAATGIAACGGDDEPDEDVQAILDQAFSQPIDSADVAIDFSLDLEDGDEPADPIRLQLSGPYAMGRSDQIPSFDLDGAVEGFGAQLPGVGLISTGRNLYLEVEGVPYALGRQVVAQETKALGAADDAEAGLAALGIEPREWIEGGEVEEDVDVAGVPTTHVAAGVDVAALVADVNQAAQLLPEVGGGPAPVLSEEQASVLDEAIGDPRLDVFVGEDDDTIRRLAVTLAFDVPEEDRAAFGGVGSGTASFSIEFANVNQGQRIRAPRNARPLEDLASQIVGLGALFGLPEIPGLTAPGTGGGGRGVDRPGGEGSGDGGGGRREPGGGRRREPGGEALGGAGGAFGALFQRYGECLLRADPGDQAALERCGELLTR